MTPGELVLWVLAVGVSIVGAAALATAGVLLALGLFKYFRELLEEARREVGKPWDGGGS